MPSLRRLLPTFAILLTSLSFVLLGVQPAIALQDTAVSRGFSTSDTNVVAGTLVSTSASSSSTVELATQQSANRLAGVTSKTTLVELNANKQSQAQVILSGTAQTLVSDINGSIRTGDKITVSPINGVGMLATSDSQIVGTAQTTFNTNTASSQTITDRTGKKQTVHIGYIPVQITISYYVAPTAAFLPPFLQKLANNVAGRPVSAMRILVSTVLLLLAFVAVFALIFTSVRAGLISLGRNPLAAGAIQRGLVGVGLTTLLVVIFSLLAVYLVLIY